jgi:hypothetical protein
MRKFHFPVILQSNWQRSGCFSLVLSLPDIHILPNPFLTIWSVFSPGICLSFAPDLNRVEKRACITQLLHCSGTVTRPHSEYCTYIDQLERLPTTAIRYDFYRSTPHRAPVNLICGFGNHSVISVARHGLANGECHSYGFRSRKYVPSDI